MPNLFVDVDDTLALYDKAGPNPYGIYLGTPWSPNQPLIDGIRRFAEDNSEALIVIWSGGGKDYAKQWSEVLGLDDLMVPMDKSAKLARELVKDGDIAIDDMPVFWRTHTPDEWPNNGESVLQLVFSCKECHGDTFWEANGIRLCMVCNGEGV